MVERIFDILMNSFQSIIAEISELLKGNEPQNLIEYRNSLKMHVYLVHWFFTLSKTLVSKTKPKVSDDFFFVKRNKKS